MRNDIESTAVLINLLLRGYLQFNLYDQAINLLSKYFFPPSASNNEWARYLFYNGRIKAMQLEYSEAHKSLVEAIQKAPKDEAIGFKQIVIYRLIFKFDYFILIGYKINFRRKNLRS